MGRSNSILMPLYEKFIPRSDPTAMLGYDKNVFNLKNADLYDKNLGNWEINSRWELKRRYQSIISTRCPYFSKDPHDFIRQCYDNLNPRGEIFLDWAYGDHWRFPVYKIGWVKNEEHEFCYGDTNFLWSGVWDESFKNHPHFQLFSKRVEKFGYMDVEKAIKQETPKLLEMEYISNYFDIQYDLYTLWEDLPQLYIFIKGVKK